jgi:hypothetical protein
MEWVKICIRTREGEEGEAALCKWDMHQREREQGGKRIRGVHGVNMQLRCNNSTTTFLVASDNDCRQRSAPHTGANPK